MWSVQLLFQRLQQPSQARDEKTQCTSKCRKSKSEERENGAGPQSGISDGFDQGPDDEEGDLAVHQVQLLAIEDGEVEVEQGQDEAAHLEEAHRGWEGDSSPEVLSVAEGSEASTSLKRFDPKYAWHSHHRDCSLGPF